MALRENRSLTCLAILVAMFLVGCVSNSETITRPSTTEGPATTDPPAVATVPRTVAEQGDISAVPGTAEGIAAVDGMLRELGLTALIAPQGDPRGSLQTQPVAQRTIFIAASPSPANFLSVTTQRESDVPTCSQRLAIRWRAVGLRGVSGCAAPAGPVGMVEWPEAGWTFHVEYQGADEPILAAELSSWTRLG